VYTFKFCEKGRKVYKLYKKCK